MRASEVVRLFELQFGMALWARENLEQFLRDHVAMVVPFDP